MKRSLTVSSLIAGSIAAALTIAGVRWNSAIRRDAAKLRARPASEAPPFSSAELAGLPDPVVRYFEFALRPGQPFVRSARVRQSGEFAMRAGDWSPFTAVEYFAADPPGFLWDARIRMAGIIPFYIRDGYSVGAGALFGTVAALIPVVREQGTPALASGELLRYLAEAVLFPTALLPRNGISWAPLDDASARVTLADGPTTVSCDVTFSERGEIVRISAMRYRTVDGKQELTQWVGRWSDYESINDMMIPRAGAVEWILPAGPFPYWRGRMTDVRYELAR